MEKLQTTYNRIGDERLEALWNLAESKIDYDKAEWFIESYGAVYAALEEIKNKDLMLEVDGSINAYVSCAMYQGFVIGFQEAIKLLTMGNAGTIPRV
ncbi:hypothetical protein [Acetobacterium bakii]|uniref:Uncharacterized protein n=1 Tax=Acetobacterium bakii TaxID=52689 RepID=A0A0L6TZG3_9FIRM|nr:hypothetical protein [Acetobacterium bakii]KNZ41462.1 hypothetical protein AKG39_11900 [Acetobacterium bakii]